jgi:hypothetical protein
MFCPECRDEYRPGFTRCATCDVDLVESLDDTVTRSTTTVLPEVAAEEATANFCGFLTLEEAREARDKVRAAAMPAEILIRDVSNFAAGEPLKEEFWLRVRPRDFRAIVGIIGFTPASSEEPAESFKCSACGATVGANDATCPGCGLGFEG